MLENYEKYRNLGYDLPKKNWAWNMYGSGLENIGREGKPESFSIPEPNDDQLLVRVDAVGLCFSDVKLIKQGGEHAKIYHRDLSKEPTRLGHEATFTVIKVGKYLWDQYQVGQRLAIQPDIYVNKRATAYGYTTPGGLIQYHLIGDEVLKADGGSYLIPVSDGFGYAEAAMTEPWACVEAAYTQRRRLTPIQGGFMWICGSPDDSIHYQFTAGLEKPSKIVLTGISAQVRDLVFASKNASAEVVERPELSPDAFGELGEEFTGGVGFDDIVLLQPKDSLTISLAAKLIAFRGTLNMASQQPVSGLVSLDAGRVHYHYTTYIGTNSHDISKAYGEARNRSELTPDGVLVVVGGAGPMGQMHVQRALELAPGPETVIVTDLNDNRLNALRVIGDPIAEKNHKKLLLVNTSQPGFDLVRYVRELTDGKMAEDVVVCVPNGNVMQEAALLLGKDGMLNFFAGVQNGTMIDVDVNNIFMNNMQITGTSGSTIDDQKMVIQKTTDKKLSPNLSVAAVGGLNAAVAGMDAMIKGTFTGKIIIYPQIQDLPLLSLNEFADQYPEIAKYMGPNNSWSRESEMALLDTLWKSV